MPSADPKKKSVLPYSRTNLWLVDPEELILIDDEKHPLYDPRISLPVDEPLVLNIMVYGVLEPINGRRTPGDKVEVVDGRRRVKAAREANRRLKAEGKNVVRVPVVLRNGDPNRLYGVMVGTNEHRLDDTVLGRARKAAKFFDMGATEEEVANAFGVSAVTVGSWMRLLSVSPELLKEVEKGNMSATTVAQAAGDPQAIKALTQKAEEGDVVPPKRGRPQGKSTRPSKKAIQKLHSKLQEEQTHPAVIKALGWVLGLVSEEDFREAL